MLLRYNPRRFYLVLESVRSAALGTVLPIFALYYRHFEISLFQIAVLAAIFEVTILLWEVPSGVWADRFSRRSAIIISECGLAIGGLLLVGLPGLWVFVVAEMILGIGEAFGSGSVEAWVVDELQIGDDRRATESLFAAALRWKTIAMLGGAVFAGVVGAANLRWVWVPFAILHVGGLVLSLSIHEARPGNRGLSPDKPRTRQIVTSGVNRLRQSIVLKILIGFGLVCAFAEEGIDQFWQVQANESLHIPVLWFGILVAIPSLFIFLFAPRVITSMGRRLPPIISISIFQAGLAAGVFGFAMFGPLPAVFCLGAVFVFVDLKKPVISAWANEQIVSEHRAAMLSFLNMVSSAGEVAASLAFGYLAGLLGLGAVFILAGCVSLAAMFLLYIRRGATGKGREDVSNDEGS